MSLTLEIVIGMVLAIPVAFLANIAGYEGVGRLLEWWDRRR